MNGQELAASLFNTLLSWPTFALVAVLVLRTPISDLLGRIRSGELMGGKFTFGDRLGHAEEATADALAGTNVPIGEAGPPLPVENPAPHRDAAVVILSAWERLSNSLRALYQAVGLASLDRGRPPTPSVMAQKLERKDVVNSAFVTSVGELQQLRNAVAHGRHEPTQGEATAYSDTAYELSNAANYFASLKGTATPIDM